MAGFDLSELLPFYLDETDEHIAGLNEMLLKLEQAPGDEKALREAFRMVHSIKGSAAVMGFGPVKELTHHLETFFDQIRAGRRGLDRPFLDLCFRCLDALRDDHADLRAGRPSTTDLAGLTALVVARLEATEPATEAPAAAPPAPAETAESPPGEADPTSGAVTIRVSFEPDIPWPDMKARLVLNRLGTKGRILGSDPPADKLDAVESLREFTVRLASEGDINELHALADVDGVASIDIVTPPVADIAPPAPEPAADTIAAPAPQPAPPEPERRKARVVETVRVDADRLDYLMNLAGELVINKARFAEIARGLDDVFRGSNTEALAVDTLTRLDALAGALEDTDSADARSAAQLRRLRENVRAILDELERVRQGRDRLNAMADAIHQLGRVSDGIQKGVLETRMVPIGPLFERFHRVVRDLRLSSHKEVALRVEGEKTELDKRMIDELADPLVHMVRNSVDHGLEPPDEREASGKPRAGTVLLGASHRGNSVVITVSDDGRGIDCARVRKKAVAQGLITDDEARRLTDRQALAYIFHPGLSTAERITEVSGRGVGMDIVKGRIEDLSGSLDVRSEPGVGTTFTIRLPLTLAIMPVLLVRVRGEAYAIPLDHLAEIVEVPTAQVRRVQGRRTIKVRGRVIALVGLDELFHGVAGPGCEVGNGKQTAVVVSDGESTVGLVVDQLIGMQEAVLKSLEKNYRPVPGLSGASILGDGRVSLILDIDALIRLAASETLQPTT